VATVSIPSGDLSTLLVYGALPPQGQDSKYLRLTDEGLCCNYSATPMQEEGSHRPYRNNEHVWVPIKLYLQKQASDLWVVVCQSLVTGKIYSSSVSKFPRGIGATLPLMGSHPLWRQGPTLETRPLPCYSFPQSTEEISVACSKSLAHTRNPDKGG